MKVKAILAAVAAVAFAGQALAKGPNLVRDGSFQSPTIVGRWAAVASGYDGWYNVGDVLEIGYAWVYGLPCDNAACKDEEVNAYTWGDVYQVVSGLKKGTEYSVSFSYGGRVGAPTAMGFLLNGAQQGGPIGGSVGHWTNYSFDFIASGATEKIEFLSYHLGTKSEGNEITNVSLNALTPEPESWMIMIVGLGAAGAGLRRKSART